MKFDYKIRELSLNFYWQKIYSSSKEINGIYLFENRSNFTGFQVMFLYWLEVYSMLYRDLAMQEYTNLSEDVIKDYIRCDAFLYWRQKYQERKISDTNTQIRQSSSRSKVKGRGKSYNIFKGATNKGGNI